MAIATGPFGSTLVPMAVGSLYSFGPFELDARTRRLVHAGTLVQASARHLAVLLALVARPGTVISKDALVEAGWHDVAVTDNSLEQAISALRRALGNGPNGESYIQTVPRQGYRFVGDVLVRAPRVEDDVLDGLVAPHRAWVEGRAALETLVGERIVSARLTFERLVQVTPDDPLVHIGMANACAMQFETTRADEAPDLSALTLAAHHAREACRLNPQSGEAWATHGFVLERTGQGDQARAALTKATSIEPDNWRHHFRLGLVSWGEERLREARRTLALLPGMPLAHFLVATVLVARQTLDEAERELERGLESMQAGHASEKFPGVGLEWLLGLMLLARGAEADALTRFERELGQESRQHLYTRECCAQAWYAIGAVHLRHGRSRDAVEALHQASSRLALHPARLVLATIAPGDDTRAGGPQTAAAPPDGQRPARNISAVDLALAQAIGLAANGAHNEAAACVEQALATSSPGSQGWLIPVEPMLRVAQSPAAWATVLARLRSRAA